MIAHEKAAQLVADYDGATVAVAFVDQAQRFVVPRVNVETYGEMITVSDWCLEAGANVDQARSDCAKFLFKNPLVEIAALEECVESGVEPTEIVGVVDDARWIAIAPRDVNCVFERDGGHD